MTYKEATTYLFDSVPMFQNVGGTAYKEGLSNTLLLDEAGQSTGYPSVCACCGH